MGVLFDTFFAAGADGTMVARVEKGEAVARLPSVADRTCFLKPMAGDQPVVSDPLRGRVSNTPIVVIAAPVTGADGRRIGVVAGSLNLRSASLFWNLSGIGEPDGSRILVMDRAGALLAHPDHSRVCWAARATSPVWASCSIARAPRAARSRRAASPY